MAYQPKFSITPHLIKMIEEISAYRQKISSATLQVPWIPILQRDARVRTTHSSTAIEGNPLTLAEVAAIEQDRPVTVGNRAKREILNHLAGLKFIEKQQNKKIITTEDLLRLHKIIATGVMDQGVAGKYRTIGVRVGNFIPPSAKEVPKLMKEYIEWWNKSAKECSPIISSAILHYRFEAIHPFADGNGRMGRALALWELYRRGFDTHHIFSVDEIYWENRSRYYSQLDHVRKAKDDLTSWLEFSADAIHWTLERVLTRIERLAIKQLSRKLVLTPKQEQIMTMLRDQGGLTPKAIWQELKISKQAAAKILRPLITTGLIRRIGTRKSGKFVIG